MTTIRTGSLISVFVVGALACSAAPDSPATNERSGSIEQRVEACAHPLCATGVNLQPSCDPCATQLCAQDPYCCNTAWDATCVGEVTSICGMSCTAPGPDAGPTTCAHPLCATGGALSSSCDPCATQLCAQDPYCCSTAWDATCVSEVGSICGQTCN